jgi:fluoroquinolone resistance protein
MNTITSGQEYHDQKFKKVSLEKDEVITGIFVDCRFVNCTFTSAVLRNCRFKNCVIQNCDLSLAKISGSSFPMTRFEKSELIGINWTQGNWSNLGFGKPKGFSECVLSHGTFIGIDLSGIEMKDCIAVDVDFRETNLSKVVFGKTDLSKSIFGNTNLSEADLRCARNYDIALGQNNIKRAKFTMPEAIALLYSTDIELEDEECG